MVKIARFKEVVKGIRIDENGKFAIIEVMRGNSFQGVLVYDISSDTVVYGVSPIGWSIQDLVRMVDWDKVKEKLGLKRKVTYDEFKAIVKEVYAKVLRQSCLGSYIRIMPLIEEVKKRTGLEEKQIIEWLHRMDVMDCEIELIPGGHKPGEDCVIIGRNWIGYIRVLKW